jgi:hypothetical protein
MEQDISVDVIEPSVPTLEEDLAPTMEPRSASAFVKLCAAEDADRVAYCEGYLEALLHYLKYKSSCMPDEILDRTYCQGATEAQEKINSAWQSCKDCSFEQFRPDLQDDAARRQLFNERMKNFRDELGITLGTCELGGDRIKNYCLGFNAEKNLGVSMNLGSPKTPENAYEMGVSDVALDLFAVVYAYGHNALKACVPVSLTPEEAKDILLEFVRENPEQQIDTIAPLLVAKALFYDLCKTAISQNMRPHVEQCVQWSHHDSQPGVMNICDKTIVIVFILERASGPELKTEQLVIKGGHFHADKRLLRAPWRSTACPEGYVSSVPFDADNLDTIAASDYGCIKDTVTSSE